MNKITPFLWFDHQAQEAVDFYISIFNNSNAGPSSKYEEESAKKSGKPKGSTMLIPFKLNGQDFIALNGGPQFRFTEAISFLVNCQNQKEVDYFWDKLSQGGQPGQCGWLKDKFGISWQIVPTELEKLIASSDSNKSNRVMSVLLKMNKIIISDLKKAYHGTV